jgi:prepilin-type N-terminal cleavage/methylation domain-containing protein
MTGKTKSKTSTRIGQRTAAFTLVELLIVVSILGILAAIVLPEFQNHIQQSKEAAAKANLKILHEAIERYAAEHNNIPPGYPADNPAAPVTYPAFILGLVSGGYLSNMPENPFNDLQTIKPIQNNQDFPAAATGDFGWVYKANTRTIRLDWPGTDSTGNSYFEY